MRLVSWLAVAFIAWAFIAAYVAISLAPAPFWVDANAQLGVPDIQRAYALIFGQGMWTIAGSIIAFLVGQLIDVTVFRRIRKLTGERWLWLRATGSTAVSQLFDSFIVLYIAFVIGPQHWPVPQFLAVGTVNYCLQDAGGRGDDPAAVSGACRRAALSRRRRNRTVAARSRALTRRSRAHRYDR